MAGFCVLGCSSTGGLEVFPAQLGEVGQQAFDGVPWSDDRFEVHTEMGARRKTLGELLGFDDRVALLIDNSFDDRVRTTLNHGLKCMACVGTPGAGGSGPTVASCSGLMPASRTAHANALRRVVAAIVKRSTKISEPQMMAAMPSARQPARRSASGAPPDLDRRGQLDATSAA